MRVVGLTDMGLVRQNNEDSFWIDQEQGLFIICDGMGGHRGGEVASYLAVQTIREYMETNRHQAPAGTLVQSIEQANRIIFQTGHENAHLYEMGTTITAALIQDFHLVAANVGDSGLYLIREGVIRKITHDHTLAEQMLAEGVLKPDEIKDSSYNHILTRALGIDTAVKVDVFEEDLKPDDILLLCSDGLTDMVPDEDLLKLILQAGNDMEQAAQALVQEALSRGGHDNITMVLLRLN